MPAAQSPPELDENIESDTMPVADVCKLLGCSVKGHDIVRNEDGPRAGRLRVTFQGRTLKAKCFLIHVVKRWHN